MINTIEQLVQFINDEFNSDATAEQQAGEYALVALQDDFSTEEIEAHLDILSENGAIFNFQDAVEWANKLYLERF